MLFRTILSSLFILITLSCFSQENAYNFELEKGTSKIMYREVVQEKGSQEELFNRAIEWINKEYKNPVSVTRVRNPHTGIIDIIHKIEITYVEKDVTRSAGTVDYFLKLELKENRYRYTITDLTLRSTSRIPIEKWLDTEARDYSPAMADYLKQVDEYCVKLISSLKEGMKPQFVPVEEEW